MRLSPNWGCPNSSGLNSPSHSLHSLRWVDKTLVYNTTVLAGYTLRLPLELSLASDFHLLQIYITTKKEFRMVGIWPAATRQPQWWCSCWPVTASHSLQHNINLGHRQLAWWLRWRVWWSVMWRSNWWIQDYRLLARWQTLRHRLCQFSFWKK